MDAYQVIKQPLITEKSTLLKEKNRVVAFKVDVRANKKEIKEAVEKIFKVKVEKVRVVRMHGKPKRQGRIWGRRPDWKKAYVTLREGEKMIEFLESA